jgi:hypothetical protein
MARFLIFGTILSNWEGLTSMPIIKKIRKKPRHPPHNCCCPWLTLNYINHKQIIWSPCNYFEFFYILYLALQEITGIPCTKRVGMISRFLHRITRRFRNPCTLNALMQWFIVKVGENRSLGIARILWLMIGQCHQRLDMTATFISSVLLALCYREIVQIQNVA